MSCTIIDVGSTLTEARWAVAPVVAGSRLARIGIVAVIALSSGAMMATVAAARRTTTAYDRLIEFSDPADVSMGGASDEEELARLSDSLSASPVVERFAESPLIGAAVQTPDGTVLSFERLFVVASAIADGPTKVIEGRLPDPAAPTEAVVSAITAKRLDLGVGDQVTLINPPGFNGLGPDLSSTIVGVIATPGSFPSIGGRVLDLLIVGPSFVESYPASVAQGEGQYDVWLVDGADSVAEFRAEGERLGFSSVDVDEQSEVTRGVNRLIRVEAWALLIAGIVAASAGFIVMFQLLRRHVDAESASLHIVTALGVTGRGIAVGGALFGAALALIGASCGAAAAWLTSAITPFGTAGLAEPDPGLHTDWPVLAIGVVITVSLAACAGGLAARRTIRHRPFDATGRTFETHLPEPVGSGVRFAFTTGSGRSVGGLGVLAIVVALLVTATGIGVMLGDVQRDPSLSGGWWDAFFGAFDQGGVDALASAVANDGDIAESAIGGWAGEEIIGGEQVGVMYVDANGSLKVPMSAGRQPSRPNEVAFGRSVMDRLGVEVGDVIEMPLSDVTGRPVVETLDIVGETVFAAPQWFTMAPGEGALVDLSLLEQVEPGSTAEGLTYLIRFDGTADPSVALDELAQSIDVGDDGNFGFFARGPRSDVEAYGTVTRIPVVLAIELAVLLVATLLHLTLTGARRHRSDIAVLRSLGFTPGQTVSAHMTQAVTIALVALVVGIPLGLAVTAITWRQIADQLVVLPTLTMGSATLEAIVVGCLALALVVGATVGRRVTRRQPSLDLNQA